MLFRSNKTVFSGVMVIAFIFIGENKMHDRLIRKGVPQNIKAFMSFAEEAASYIKTKKRVRLPVKAISKDQVPHLFVMVIGESASRRHHSLYGYVRNTNPKLAKRKDLMIYTDAISPYSGTLKSVLAMMTESDILNHKPVDRCVSLDRKSTRLNSSH